MRLGNGRALLSLTLTWHKAVFSQCTRPCSRRAGKPHITSPMSPPLRWELQTEAGAGTLQEGTNRKERPPVKRRQTFRVHVYASKHAHTHVHTHTRMHTHACTHTQSSAYGCFTCCCFTSLSWTWDCKDWGDAFTTVNTTLLVLYLAECTHNQDTKPQFSGRKLHLQKPTSHEYD